MTTTETPTDTFTAEPTITAAEPTITATIKTNAFLGLYVPVELKAKIHAASKSERRSMSSFAVGVFEEFFNPVTQ
jgi:hypothetical protein